MSGNSKKILLIIICAVTAIALVISVTMYAFFTYRDKIRGEEQASEEQEGTTAAGESELLDEPEESSVEKETVAVEGGDAVSELYAALNTAVSGEDADMAKAIDAFSNSAEQGNSDAMYFLGEIYFQGIGVEPDFGKAGEYFKKACENGNRKAMSIYGKMLFMGNGAPQNYDESASCFYTVAEEDGEASYVLGVMSNLGIGVPRSAKRAGKYIDKAEALGYGKAGDYRGKIYDNGKSTDGTDGFKLAGKNVQDLDYKTEHEDLQDLVDKYHSILKKTESYAAFDSEMADLLDVDVNGASSFTLFGNNGYLFYQDEKDGNPLHDYIGDNHFSEDEMKAVAKNLGNVKKQVEEKGAKFVVMIIPNKEIVYSEYMPAYIKRAGTVTRADRLVEYLKANTDIEIVYVKESLMANKDNFPLYYKTDTHTNMVGSLFMIADLFKACYGAEIVPSLEKFDIHKEDFMGDLGNLAKCTGRYASDKVYFYPKRSVGEGDKIDSSMMLVGDSFSDFISTEIAYYLTGGIDHRMITEYNFDYRTATNAGLESLKSEYVVWECVERYLDRLK